MSRPVRDRHAVPMVRVTPQPHHVVALRPAQLAELLEAWAFRREKVLTVLDIHAAQAAHALAQRCRLLALADDDDPLADGEAGPLALEWLEIREAVAKLLQKDAAYRPHHEG